MKVFLFLWQYKARRIPCPSGAGRHRWYQSLGFGQVADIDLKRLRILLLHNNNTYFITFSLIQSFDSFDFCLSISLTPERFLIVDSRIPSRDSNSFSRLEFLLETRIAISLISILFIVPFPIPSMLFRRTVKNARDYSRSVLLIVGDNWRALL